MTTPVSADVTGVVVARIRPRTAAAAAGLTRGDRVLAINGHRLRDAIDFQFHAGEPELELRVERDGTLLTLPLERRGADLGVELEPPRAGEIATCANKCVFCFIHQLPKGMRRSLYVKDDDFRLSFLHGNYITLTDLDEAAIATVEGWQHRWLAELGSRFVFLADEIYLLAGRPLPPARAYEGFPVVEDGIGLVRRFEDGFAKALVRRPPPAVRGPVTLVTGEMFGPRLRVLLAGAGLDRHGVRVAAVPHDFFGHAIGVAGLLTGQDVRRHLATQPELGRAVLVPAVAVRDVDGVFLDDLTAADLARDLGVGVRVVEPSPTALLRALGRV